MTRTNFGGRWAWSVGTGRRPPIAIVAPTSVISSGVARTSPCPIAEEPVSRSLSRLFGGIELSAAPGIVGVWLKPNLSAIASSRFPPTFAPSGANTELHDTANEFSSVPPQSSPLALWSV